MKLSFLWVALATSIFYMSACTNPTEGEEEEIFNYISENGLSVTDTSGIKAVIINPGSDERPSDASVVELIYLGKYLDNTIFDKSPPDKTAMFKLNSLIPGLQTGIKLLGKGGTGIIIIPSELGYGKNPPFGVRKNAVLIYEITVIDF